MPKISYQILERQQKRQFKTYVVLVVVLLASLAAYFYPNWNEYRFLAAAKEADAEFITLLRQEAVKAKGEFEEAEKAFDDLDKQLSQNLKVIFPVEDSYTELTRQIDSYEQQLNKLNNPFNVANIDYQKAVEKENYSILPFRMTIRSSRDNFTKFLHLIETSGAFSGDVRLMDISSIRLNFDDSEDEQIINFTVHINAYFQKVSN